eukprot:PhM_4_TR16817/c1_g1_i2/m.104554
MMRTLPTVRHHVTAQKVSRNVALLCTARNARRHNSVIMSGTSPHHHTGRCWPDAAVESPATCVRMSTRGLFLPTAPLLCRATAGTDAATPPDNNKARNLNEIQTSPDLARRVATDLMKLRSKS